MQLHYYASSLGLPQPPLPPPPPVTPLREKVIGTPTEDGRGQQEQGMTQCIKGSATATGDRAQAGSVLNKGMVELIEVCLLAV